MPYEKPKLTPVGRLDQVVKGGNFAAIDPDNETYLIWIPPRPVK